MQCPSCAAVVPSESRFCLTCGQPLGTPSELATMAAAPEAVAVAGPHVRRLASSDSVPVGELRPRHPARRPVPHRRALGKGGMGEVYRADDLTLGQSVALKFLPPALARDPERLARFHAEVRTARQVSHPHVCRVYDVGEADGQPFLTMEYIDGEDLAALLRRIGRLPEEKGIELARQLCQGLAAAHDRGVIHRDLKPANVMIDGRGQVRLTDFGLAAAGRGRGRAVRHARLPGAGATGRPRGDRPQRPVRAGPGPLRGLHRPAGLPGDDGRGAAAALRGGHAVEAVESRQRLDPAVERAILRCLERDPADRPRSAYEVLAALPGGDPLAAALAAGETPSPAWSPTPAARGSCGPSSAYPCWRSPLPHLLCWSL